MLDQDNTITNTTLVWPFRRYKVLLPRMIHTDAFMWLYISVVRYFNKQNGRDINTYNSSVMSEIKPRLLNMFPNIMDNQTLDKIVYEVEVSMIKDGRFRDNIEDFLNSFNDVLSDDLEVMYFFQDMVSGSVVPKFYSSAELSVNHIYEIDINNTDGLVIRSKNKPKQPNRVEILKAYESHILRTKNAGLEAIGLESRYDDESDDEDIQEDFDHDVPLEQPENKETDEVGPKKDLFEGRNIVFVDEPTILHYNIQTMKTNSLSVISPFGEYTNHWMKKCIMKSRSCNPRLDALCDEKVENREERQNNYLRFVENPELGIEAGFKHCGKLYDMLKGYNDEYFIEKLQEIEYNYSHRKREFFACCGQLLELTRDFFVVHERIPKYKRTSGSSLELKLDSKIGMKDVNLYCLTTEGVIADWFRAGESITDGTFKSSMIDLVLQTNWVRNPLFKKNSMREIFTIYNYRNDVSHAERKKKRPLPNENDLVRLTNAIELLKVVMKA